MRRLTFVLCIWLILASSVSAQRLSPADEALLIEANRTLPSSFAFDYTVHLAVEGLRTFTASADLSGSGVIDRAVPTISLSSSGELLLGNTRSISVDAEFRWLDDVLYLNSGDGWQAREDASIFVADQIEPFGFIADPAALAQLDFSGSFSDILTALAALDPASFLGVERLETVGDANTAHFQIDADLHTLMQTDAFVDVVAALANTQGTIFITYERDELAEIVRANSELFTDTTLTIDQYIGTDDSLLHRQVLTLNMPIDPSLGGYTDTPFTVSASLDITLSEHNQPQAISAPEGAVSEFASPELPPPESVGEGIYVYFGTIGENATYTQSFEAQEGDILTITVRGLGLEFDSYLRLLAVNSDVLVENDDYETAAFGLGDYDSQIFDYALPESGLYNIEISELNGAAGSFVLTITIER